jgi:hypothetical protein
MDGQSSLKEAGASSAELESILRLTSVHYRLEKGTFSRPRPAESGQRKIRLHVGALRLLLHGVDMRDARFRSWYERE